VGVGEVHPVDRPECVGVESQAREAPHRVAEGMVGEPWIDEDPCGLCGVFAVEVEEDAAVAEGLTAVLISINAIYKTRNAGIRITGIDA